MGSEMRIIRHFQLHRQNGRDVISVKSGNAIAKKIITAIPKQTKGRLTMYGGNT